MALRDSDRPVDPNYRAYLEADDSWQDGDQRFRIRIVEPVWDSASQELDYQFAVEETRDMAHPPGTITGSWYEMGGYARLEAIRVRLGIGKVSHVMPAARQTRKERDAELKRLRAQVDEGDASAPYWQR